jgi:ubiquitin thioesterase protein OTUB1
MEAFIDDVKHCHGNPETLYSSWKANEYASQSSVMLLRLLTSAFLQAHSEEYMAFIIEDGVDNCKLNSMQIYCQRNVEGMGVECDQIHIVALCNALRCQVIITYLDGSFSDLSTPLVLGQDQEGSEDLKTSIKYPLSSIHMLYRPGHYDLLY